MPALYKDTNYSLTHLIEDIRHGNIALPDIQRPFVWSPAKVRDLFDSMYCGYPVGTLMFWETGAEVGMRQVGGGETERVASRLIVDGQQRLTSLYAVLTGRPVIAKTFREQRIQIAFHPEDETFEVADAAIRRDPGFVPDITALWNSGYKSEVRKFMARLGQARGEDLSDDVQDCLEERLDRVRDLRDFRFQVIELNAGADEEQVADIFVRINSKGVTLNQANFILTLMSVHWEAGRRQIEAFCRSAVETHDGAPSPRNPFRNASPDQVLRTAVGLAFGRGRLQHVYSLLRGKDLSTGEVSAERRTAQFEVLRPAVDEVVNLTNWHEFLKCLTSAGFRSARMIASENAIIFTYVIWLIGKRKFRVGRKPLRELTSRWFFMAHTTGRYTSSPESQLEADLRVVNGVDDADGFRDALDRIIRSNFTRDYWSISLPNRLDTSGAKSPVLLAYWAALNLLDAEVLFGTLKMRELLDPAVTPSRTLERHHLFPKAHLEIGGITARNQVNAIANMAFVDWPENSDIGARAPYEYWRTLTDGIPAETVERQRYWHALPVGWEQLDYQAFLERRRKLIADVIKDGFEKLHSTVSPLSRPATIIDLIEGGESEAVEFKSTARWNLRALQVDKKLEHVIVKTVCGFLNAEGGTLIVGVRDDGEILGLDDDLRTLRSKPNLDGYELFLRTILDNNLSMPTAGVVRIRFEQLNGTDVCAVAVAASAKPVFAKGVSSSESTEFWVRVGNATKQLYGNEMLDYQSSHWT